MKKYKVQQHNKKPVFTPWQHHEGVFQMSNGSFICRVKIKNGYSTISKHVTEPEAEKAYEDYNNNQGAAKPL